MNTHKYFKLSSLPILLICAGFLGGWPQLAQAAISSVTTGIAGPSITITSETVGGSSAHVLILTTPAASTPNYKWQFLTGGNRLFIDRKAGAGFVQLISQIQTAPEYMKQQGATGNFVWNPYGLNINTTGGNVLQGFDKQVQGDGSVKLVRTYSTTEEGIAESLTETWTIPASAEVLGSQGPKVTYSMTKNRGIILTKGVLEGTWRMRWALSGIADITANSSNILDTAGYPIRKKSYSNNEFAIDVDDFDNATATSTAFFTFSEISTSNKAEILFFKDGTTGNRIVDPTTVTLGVPTGWLDNSKRVVFYNGANYFLIYATTTSGSLSYKASSDNVTWTATSTLTSGKSTTIDSFNIYLVNDTTFDLVYENSSNVIAVKTCTISSQTISCNAGDSFGDTANEYAIARAPSSNRIWVTARDAAEVEVWSSDTAGDATSAMVWTDEVAGGDSNVIGPVAMVPYGSSDKVLVTFMKNAGGTGSDGTWSRACTRSGADCDAAGENASMTVGADGELTPNFGNVIRISDTDFRAVNINRAASTADTDDTTVEYKWDGSAWSAIATISTESDEYNPSLFYDRVTEDLYMFAIDIGTAGDSVERWVKLGDGAWNATETVVDDSEGSPNRSLSVTQMHEPPLGSSRFSTRQLVWAYRVANGSNFDLKVGNLALPTPTFDQSAYRFFDNFKDAFTSDPSADADAANTIAIDTAGGFMYVAGYEFFLANNSRWYIEKHNLSDGALVTAFDTDGILTSNPSGGHDQANTIAIDTAGGFMYVAGYQSGYQPTGDICSMDGNNIKCWRIEKRDLTTGALVTAFGGDGSVTSDPTNVDDIINDIAIDTAGGFMYVVGMASSSLQWRIEKRNLSDGALVTAFDTDGVVVSDPTSGNDIPNTIAIDISGGFMYVAGYDNNGVGGLAQWRIEKRNLTTGALVTAFDTDGVVVSDPSGGGDTANTIAIDTAGGFMYVAGDESVAGATIDWRIEKRNLTTGALVTAFDSDGIATSSPSPSNDSINTIAIDTTGGFMYVAGNQSGNVWRIEKRNLSDGALVTAFDTDGIVVSDPTTGADQANTIAIDTTGGFMYVAGYQAPGGGCTVGSNCWRVEKRNLSDGGLNTGAPLADLNTVATLTNTGDAFLLRMLIHNNTATTSASTPTFKLQFVGKGAGSCASPTGGTPASYTDVDASTVISFYNNSAFGDGSTMTASSSDPTHSSHTVVTQTYEEANNFTNSVGKLTPNQDGMWGFALYDNSAPADTAYCFRAIQSDGTVFTAYTQYPQITTKATASTPALDKLHYRWRNDDGSESSATWAVATNTALTTGVYVGDRRRLRFMLSNTGGSSATSYTYLLEQASTTGASCSSGWISVPATETSGTHFVMDLSDNVVNSSVTTDNTNISNPSGKSFTAGYFMSSGNQTPAHTLTSSQFTEHEYSLRSTSNVTVGTRYCFRLTNASSITNFTYTQQPQIIVSAIAGRPQIGGAGVEGSGSGSPQGGGTPGGGGGTEPPPSPPPPQGGGTPGGGGGGDSGFLPKPTNNLAQAIIAIMNTFLWR